MRPQLILSPDYKADENTSFEGSPVLAPSNAVNRTPSISQTSGRSVVIRRRYPLVVDLGTEDVAMKKILSRCKFMRSPIDGSVVRRSDFEQQQREILEEQQKNQSALGNLFESYGKKSGGGAGRGHRDPIILMVSLDDVRCMFLEAHSARNLEHPNNRRVVEIDDNEAQEEHCCKCLIELC
eukprot:TRINITY_DN2950_c0_g1_i6.p1 TRINITY_DN2950_c0_g1~~TRINITY_DN2950_c0_g1_i6.p1  ORF type:complete len:181 (+),score=15.87 TRINITY_DN2950_c0_g1_i6:223-765(+)